MEKDTLTPRQESFCVHYTTIGSETYSNATRAALAAEYSETSASVTATQLLKKEPIRERIMELQAENMKRNLITVDKVLADLEHDKILAREHHQYGVAKSCTELQGKYLAMFVDRQQTEDKTVIVSDEQRMEQLEDELALLKRAQDIGSAICTG
ncbi:MAG: terminase small subunit [Planctomycetota bacterium]|jgi:phage terminase small subunit